MWADELRRHAEIVAIADTNPARLATFRRHLTGPAGAGHGSVGAYAAGDLSSMLRRERVELLIVCSPDATHDEHIVTGLRAGCHVVTEKPMTTDVARCRRILDAQRQTGGRVTVAFNYRYHPVHQQIQQLLPRLGEISSVHFEWLLDIRHGADYFRRWHRDRASSGGLLVHKATHHFDLVNWWLAAAPQQVTAHGRLFFYGEEGKRHGYARDYTRATGSAEARDDPFALDLAANDVLRELYLDAEAHDGYQRDLNVFAPGVSIEDDMAVLVRYGTGATMSYHLTAFSPWEGYRIAFNGAHGRLELDRIESDHVAAAAASTVKGGIHGAEDAAEKGTISLRWHGFWQPPEEIPVVAYDKTGHGGADRRMADAIFSGADAPTALDGARSLLTGLAANESISRQASVPVQSLLDLSEWES
jgi:predicted dehydrogenase